MVMIIRNPWLAPSTSTTGCAEVTCTACNETFEIPTYCHNPTLLYRPKPEASEKKTKTLKGILKVTEAESQQLTDEDIPWTSPTIGPNGFEFLSHRLSAKAEKPTAKSRSVYFAEQETIASDRGEGTKRTPEQRADFRRRKGMLEAEERFDYKVKRMTWGSCPEPENDEVSEEDDEEERGDEKQENRFSATEKGVRYDEEQHENNDADHDADHDEDNGTEEGAGYWSSRNEVEEDWYREIEE